MGMAVDELGQAGIGLDRDQPRPVLAEPLDVLGHLARPGGAVEPDHRHVERADHRRGGGDVGADQQRAGGLDRDLDEDRRVLAARRRAARLAPLTAALICSGSWQVSIRIASTPPATSPGHWFGERVLERLVRDMAERGEPRPRPDRAEHEARAAVVGELGDRLARELGGAAVEREGAVGDAELAQGDRRAAKAVGLDRVGAGLEIAAMDLAHEVGAALAEDLGAVLVAEKVALDIEIARLHLGAHRAVAEQDAVGEDSREDGPSVHGAASGRPARE